MRSTLILLFLQLWGNVKFSLSQNVQQCPVIHVDNNIYVFGDPEEATYGNVVRFSCKSNRMVLNGPSEIYCDENGEWSAQAPSCEEIKCATPEIQNGELTGQLQDYKEHEVLHFECNRKFKKQTELLSKCTKIGSKAEFSPVPVCEPARCKLPLTTLNGTTYNTSGNVFSPGDTVTTSCGDKHWISSPQNTSAVSTCNDDGEWDLTPVCQVLLCPVMYVDANVQVIGDPEEATYGNVLRFSCKSNTEVLDGPSEIYCDENGDWSAHSPSCNEIKCTITEIQNGELTGQLRDYKEHEVLHFECNGKFKKQTERPSRCTKIGTKAEFSPAPVCEPARCKLPQTSLKGTTYNTSGSVFSPGDTVTTSCGDKHWISTPQNTSAVSTCNDDGEWDLTPVCQEVRCINERHRSVRIWNVHWGQRITLDETVRYQCKTGYIAASDRARCTRDGWSPNPLCQVITCTRREVPNTDIVNNDKQTYIYDEIVIYRCKDGYEGQFILACRDNGLTGNARCRDLSISDDDLDPAT